MVIVSVISDNAQAHMYHCNLYVIVYDIYVCNMCHEPFEQFWEEEDESWHLKDAIRINDKTYHPVCYEDFKEVRLIRIKYIIFYLLGKFLIK